MNKKFFTAGLMLLALSVGIPQVFAHEQSELRGKGGDRLAGSFFHKAHHLLKAQEELKLSEEQVQSIRDLKLDVSKNLIRQHAEIEILELDIQSQLRGDKFDVAAVQKLVDQKYDAKKDMAKKVIESYAKLKTILSDKQWEALRSLKKERMKESSKEADRD